MNEEWDVPTPVITDTVNVNIVSDESDTFGTPTNLVNEITAPYATETPIVSYTVPVNKEFNITKVIGWGDYDGEFFVRIDGVFMGGGRNSTANRTLTLMYEMGPIMATAGQLIEVSIFHYSPSMQIFKVTVEGGLKDA